MKRSALFCYGLLISFVFSVGAFADEKSKSNYDIYGSTAFQAGQFVKGVNAGGPIDHKWTESFLFELGVDASVHKRLHVYASGQMITTFSHRLNLANIDVYKATQFPMYSFIPTQAHGVIGILGDFSNPVLQLGIGFIPFKYNPDVHNLGEFLFRSGTYPAYLLNDFDTPFARLLGFRLSSRLPIGQKTMLKQDLFLSSQARMYPFMDWSISYVAGFSLSSLFELGAGISFSNLFSIDKKITEPYVGGQNLLPDSSGNYAFAGTKMMARISIDPKALFEATFFGNEDLKLYSELAILGVKDYPVYYDDIGQRIPVVFGFNFPAFKILDVLSIELEFWNSRYPNSWNNVYATIPRPVIDSLSTLFPHDKIKWSIYAKKEILKGFSIIGQAASDHIQPISHAITMQDRTDVLQKTSDWWWIGKFQFDF